METVFTRKKIIYFTTAQQISLAHHAIVLYTQQDLYMPNFQMLI